MATKEQVIALHEQCPGMTSIEIADALGCSPAYVRATAQRNGLGLPHASRAGKKMRADQYRAIGEGFLRKAEEMERVQQKMAQR